MPGFNIPLDQYKQCDEQTRITQFANGTTNFGSTSLSRASSISETARAHRWRLEFKIADVETYDGLRTSSTLTTYAKTCQRPSFEVDIITIHHQAEEIYRPGKYRWNTIDIAFYELMLGDKSYKNKTAEEVYIWWTGTLANRHRQASVRTLNNTVISILELDGSGNVARRYVLYNCKLIKNSPSDLDHGSSEISITTLTIKYDYADEYSEG